MNEDYEFYTYIMASESGVLYTGMTNNLIRRVQEHKDGTIEWFTKKYKCHKLVYFEFTQYVYNAIAREKEIKHFLRKEKVALIESRNPSWKDLYPELLTS
jgi:putative endonuclease